MTYTNDVSGQAVRRDEIDGLTSGDPHEIWYRYGGKQMGYTGNNGTLNTDYDASISSRTREPGTGPFRSGSNVSKAHADFDLSLEQINSYSQGGAGGSYTVRGGETLSSIAAQLWGDASLWYKLAEANGMTGSAALMEGQSLTIPAGVMKNTHNAGTFKPYDPAETLGETSPTTPQPQQQAGKKNKCGMFGAILLTVVAVAVTALTAGAAAAAITPGITSISGGMAALAAGGAAVSGGAGVLMGIGDAGIFRCRRGSVRESPPPGKQVETEL